MQIMNRLPCTPTLKWRLQSPMFEATDTLNQLLTEQHDLHLMDAAGEVGVPEAVEKLLRAAGFSHVQVLALPS